MFSSILRVYLFSFCEIFRFSVTVSAKEGDGSVHAAIQTLVRHLLQKQVTEKKKDKIGNIFRSNEAKDEDLDNEKPFVPFFKVDINEVCCCV